VNTSSDTTDFARAAARLLSTDSVSLDRIGGGRNSQVYQLTSAAGRYALKAYFADTRNRLRTEFQALTFVWNNGLDDVPRPIATCPEHSFAIYSWIEGRRPDPITPRHIATATDFIERLAALRHKPGADSLPNAAEAYFSGRAVLENCRARLAPLLTVYDPPLHTFLDTELIPAIAAAEKRIGQDLDLPPEARTLSSSDFGFHNSLETLDHLYFLDFEYFGWDHPAKLVCDFLLHPAMSLSVELKRQFTAESLAALSFCPNLRAHIEAFYPLFGIKWCLILLNEFLPDHLLRRQFAGMSPGARREKQLEQLAKSTNLLRKTLSQNEHFPYFA
jgi:hypothetical protein